MADNASATGPRGGPPDRAFTFVLGAGRERRRMLISLAIRVGALVALVATGLGVGVLITRQSPGTVAAVGSRSVQSGLEGFGVNHPILALPAPNGAGGTVGDSGTGAGGDASTAPPPSGRGASTPLPPSPPTRIWIPDIGVASPLIRLGLEPDGSLQVPSDFSVAGWWAGGPSPGEKGAAVIVGHVDSTSGPAVFFRLRQLRPGDVVWVRRVDGAQVRFVVQRLEEVSKRRFPTQQVYGAQPYAALRLVTCGGAFDYSTGHYVDNIIVFAAAAAS